MSATLTVEQHDDRRVITATVATLLATGTTVCAVEMSGYVAAVVATPDPGGCCAAVHLGVERTRALVPMHQRGAGAPVELLDGSVVPSGELLPIGRAAAATSAWLMGAALPERIELITL